MTLRRVAIADIKPFAYAFEAGIGGTMTDVGRTLGSDTIGLIIQTVKPGDRSSRRHRHLFQEEILVVMAGEATLIHGEERVPMRAGEAVCYRAGDPEPHSFENTGASDLVIWAFGNRFSHEVCLYPDQGVAFVEGLGAEVPLAEVRPSDWTEDRRKT
jgi:uncharacterized cupin superfamily protein